MIAAVRGTFLTRPGARPCGGLAHWALDIPFPYFSARSAPSFPFFLFGGTALVRTPVRRTPFGPPRFGKGIVMIAIAAFLIYRDNYLTRAGLLVTPEGARQVELSLRRGDLP